MQFIGRVNKTNVGRLTQQLRFRQFHFRLQVQTAQQNSFTLLLKCRNKQCEKYSYQKILRNQQKVRDADYAKRSFHRAANGIFGGLVQQLQMQLSCNSSKENVGLCQLPCHYMVLQPVLSKSGYQITGFYHRPSLYEIVQNNQHGYCQLCQDYFNFELSSPSDTVKCRTLKFESTFVSTLV